MINNRKYLFWFAVVGIVLLSACQAVPELETTLISLNETQNALTVNAVLSQTLSALSVTNTPRNTITPTPEPSITPTRTSTEVPTQTNTPTPSPTHTRVPTNTPRPTPTPVPIPCNRAEFIDDITIEDGSIISPRKDFIKVWRVKNTGSCAWTKDYGLAFSHGELMSGNTFVPMPEAVPPGQTIDVAVELIAPREEGHYRGYWHFKDNFGREFGLGNNANGVFWVDIQVGATSSDSGFKFADNFCDADWENATAHLPCPGQETDPDGFVVYLEDPALENRHENQPTLWVHPNETREGYIEGRYPKIWIEQDARFQAWVGCMEDYPKCDLTFYLDVITSSGRYENLGEWHEVNDGMVTKIDIDLSSFEETLVEFILGVRVNNANFDQAQGFWFVPRINY